MVKVYQFFDKCVKAVGDIFQMESSFWFILYHNIETYYQTPDPFHFQTLLNSFKM